MKPFILMTTGRTGSTALMDSLSIHKDIAVPHKQIDCIDNEILHPKFVNQYIPFYQQFSQTQIKTEADLINSFFTSNQSSNFAGFKSMPERHQQLEVIINTPSIQIITLIREDIASTIASFIIAIDKSTWRRNGEQQQHQFSFNETYKPRILGHLKYILDSYRSLKRFPNAIHLVYEDLCQQNFKHEVLNQFFGRSIQLIDPKPAINAESYVKNWDEYLSFVNQSVSLYKSNAPS